MTAPNDSPVTATVEQRIARIARLRPRLARSLHTIYPRTPLRECECLANAVVDEAVLNGYMSPLRAVRRRMEEFLAKHRRTGAST